MGSVQRKSLRFEQGKNTLPQEAETASLKLAEPFSWQEASGESLWILGADSTINTSADCLGEGGESGACVRSNMFSTSGLVHRSNTKG